MNEKFLLVLSRCTKIQALAYEISKIFRVISRVPFAGGDPFLYLPGRPSTVNGHQGSQPMPKVNTPHILLHRPTYKSCRKNLDDHVTGNTNAGVEFSHRRTKQGSLTICRHLEVKNYKLFSYSSFRRALLNFLPFGSLAIR